MISIARNEWIFENISAPSKEELIRLNILNMLQKTTMMFKYKNLPEHILEKDIEIQMQVGGYCIWTEVDGKLYTFRGGLGGEPNPYYLPTLAVVANPALKFNKTLTIGEDCVVMLNDHFYQGLMPIHRKYATLLAEAEISLRHTLINARIPALVEADNETAKESAEKFFEKIVRGDDYGIIAGKALLDNLKTHDFLKISHIKDVIESVQYIKGTWFNEIGLKAAFNMKREAINEAEANLNDDILYPSVDNMLKCRRIGLEKINKMYGKNIEVELDTSWINSRTMENLSIDKARAEVKEIEEESKNEDIRNSSDS